MVSSCEVEKKALHGWVEIAKLSTQSIIRTSSEDGRASGCGSGRICGSETEVESLAPGAKAASIRTCFRHCASSMRAARTPQDCSSSFLFFFFLFCSPPWSFRWENGWNSISRLAYPGESVSNLDLHPLSSCAVT